MTYAEEQHWKTLGEDAINAEMERRLAIWLEQRTGQRFQVRQAYQDDLEGCGLKTRVIFRGSRKLALIEARGERLAWIEHQDAPATNPSTRANVKRSAHLVAQHASMEQWALDARADAALVRR